MSAIETLPELLERRRGIRPRTTWLVAAAVAVLVVAGYLLLRSPYGGRELSVHPGPPRFNVLTTPLVRIAKPRGDELLRLVAHRGPVRAVGTVRPLHLPEYAGDVAGLLPVYADVRARGLAAAIPGFRQTVDERARVHTGPAYWVGFTSTAGAGFDILALPPEVKHPRTGAVLVYRATFPPGHLKPRQRKVLKEVKQALRSFTFGSGRI